MSARYEARATDPHIRPDPAEQSRSQNVVSTGTTRTEGFQLPSQLYPHRKAISSEEHRLQPRRLPRSTVTSDESLTQDYYVRFPPEVFFKVGKVFKALWHSPSGADVHGRLLTRDAVLGRFNEPIYSSLRWMMVVKQKPGYCICCPISTYGGFGLAKKNFQLSEVQAHAIIYAHDTSPTMFKDEPPMSKKSIPIRLIRGLKSIAWSCRIHFGKLQTVEYNTKVSEIGDVPANYHRLVHEYVEQELGLVGQDSMTMRTKRNTYTTSVASTVESSLPSLATGTEIGLSSTNASSFGPSEPVGHRNLTDGETGLSEISNAFLRIRFNDFVTCARYASEHPNVIDEDVDSLRKLADQAFLNSNDDLARRCLERTLMINFCRRVPSQLRALFLTDVAKGGQNYALFKTAYDDLEKVTRGALASRPLHELSLPHSSVTNQLESLTLSPSQYLRTTKKGNTRSSFRVHNSRSGQNVDTWNRDELLASQHSSPPEVHFSSSETHVIMTEQPKVEDRRSLSRNVSSSEQDYHNISDSESSSMRTRAYSESVDTAISASNEDAWLFVEELANRIIRRYRQSCYRSMYPVGTISRTGTGSSTSEPRTQETQATSSMPSKKRSRSSKATGKKVEPLDANENNEDDQEDDEDLPRSKRQQHDHGSSMRLFACPYTKFDPQRFSERNQHEKEYRKCAGMCLRTISRVKQHLYRTHKRPEWYCGSCYEEFKSRDLLNQHVKQRPPCEEQPAKYEEMMTDEQHKQVMGRKMGVDQREAWYKVFKILFPHATRPLSPYISTNDVATVLHFVTFFQTVGAEELYNLWRERQEQSGGSFQIEASTQSVVDEAFDIVFPQLIEQPSNGRSSQTSSAFPPSSAMLSDANQPLRQTGANPTTSLLGPSLDEPDRHIDTQPPPSIMPAMVDMPPPTTGLETLFDPSEVGNAFDRYDSSSDLDFLNYSWAKYLH